MIVVVVDSGSVVCYCPHCGAYLFTLGCVGPMECDRCGETFEVEEVSR